MRPWIAPTLLGLLAFAALLGTVRLSPGLPAGPAALAPVATQVAVDPAAPGTLLAVWNATTPGGPFATLAVAAPGPLAAHGHPLGHARLAPPGPRLGHAGYNGTALTFHAFTADGRLLASNAPPAALAPFHRHGDFRHLGPATLYLGAGQPANGTAALSGALASLAPLLRDALAGQPEGGVAVVRVERGAVAALYGPVTLAVQVERLVQAP